MANLPYNTRNLFWVGSSKKDLSAFPKAAKVTMGFALRQVQNGETPNIATPLPQFASGVFELGTASGGNAYRVVYVLKLKHGVYVLDAFVKKSKRGIALPREVRGRIARRLACAQRADEECEI
jgi:phage-related protein